MDRRTFLALPAAGLLASLLPTSYAPARGRSPHGREGAPLPGLTRCRTCGEWKGEITRGEEYGKRAHCRCEPGLCRHCGEQVYPRKIGSHYWDEERGSLVHVPVFVGMRHSCGV